MNLMELQAQSITKVIKENAGAGTSSGAVAGTSSSNVAYLPSQVPGDSLKRLAKKKSKWNVNIVTPPMAEHKVVSFENYLNITVPTQHWDNFSFSVFGRGLLENEFIADISAYLAEAYDEESSDSIETLKQTIISFLNSDQCKYYRHKCAEFIRHSGDPNLNFSTQGQALFTEQSISANLSNIINFITKYYKNNLGLIDIINHTWGSREPLSGIDIFKKFDSIFSTSINGEFKGLPFTYTSTIDMNFQGSEVLAINNESLLTRLSTQFKVEGNNIYPKTAQGFPINLCEILIENIKGA